MRPQISCQAENQTHHENKGSIEDLDGGTAHGSQAHSLPTQPTRAHLGGELSTALQRPISRLSHRIASHRIASNRIASHRIASHHIASHRIASHRIASTIHTTTRLCTTPAAAFTAGSLLCTPRSAPQIADEFPLLLFLPSSAARSQTQKPKNPSVCHGLLGVVQLERLKHASLSFLSFFLSFFLSHSFLSLLSLSLSLFLPCPGPVQPPSSHPSHLISPHLTSPHPHAFLACLCMADEPRPALNNSTTFDALSGLRRQKNTHIHPHPHRWAFRHALSSLRRPGNLGALASLSWRAGRLRPMD